MAESEIFLQYGIAGLCLFMLWYQARSHREERDANTSKVLEVVERNTEAMKDHSEAIDRLGDKMTELSVTTDKLLEANNVSDRIRELELALQSQRRRDD